MEADFSGAIYTCRRRPSGGGFLVLPMICFLFALVALLIFLGEGDALEDIQSKAVTVCLSIMGASALSVVIFGVIFFYNKKRQRICVAFFDSYMQISKTRKKGAPLQRVYYSEVCAYKFEHDTSKTSQGLHEVSTSNTMTYRHNSGRLTVEAGREVFVTDIDDIARVQAILQERITQIKASD